MAASSEAAAAMTGKRRRSAAGRGVALAVLLAVSCLCRTGVAQAHVITCSFTEPFVRTHYDPDLRTLTLVYDVEQQTDVQRNVTSRTLSPTILELSNERGEVIQRLERSYRGSDGMSDQVYPYEVRWTPRDDRLPEALYGGCR